MLVVGLTVAAALSGCQTGPEHGFWFGDARCVTSQAIVSETSEQDSSGNVSALAVTKSRFGNCTGDRSFGFELHSLESQVYLMKRRVDGSGTFVCANDIDLTFGSQFYESTSTAVDRCGYGNYFAQGWHRANPNPGYGSSEHDNTQSPDGYNA